METKRLNCKILELKLAQNDTKDMTFSGYGAVFGNVDSHGDVIAQGAFTKYINDVKSGASAWPAMLLQHGGWKMTPEDMTPIGIWTDLKEDDHGLYVEGKLADTDTGKDVYTLMSMTPRAAIESLSIGYFAIETQNGGRTDNYARLIKQIDLLEISPVTFPSNDKAKILNVKSINDLTERDIEKILRDVGFSHNEAKIFISKGFKSVKRQREVDNEDKKRVLDWLKTL